MSIDELALLRSLVLGKLLPARLADPPTIIVRTHHKGGRGPKTARLAGIFGLVLYETSRILFHTCPAYESILSSVEKSDV